jgi:hypothetical protein
VERHRRERGCMKDEIRKIAGGTARYVARWMGMGRPWCRTGTWLAGRSRVPDGSDGRWWRPRARFLEEQITWDEQRAARWITVPPSSRSDAQGKHRHPVDQSAPAAPIALSCINAPLGQHTPVSARYRTCSCPPLAACARSSQHDGEADAP